MDAQIKHVRHIRVWLVLGLVLSCWTTIIHAQSTPFLKMNAYTEGQIQAGTPQRWQFVARQGAMLSFYVRAVDDTLDPVITIETLDDELLISNDDAAYGITSDALIEGFSPPRNGTYALTISSFGEKDTGAYQLVMLPGYANMLTSEDFGNNPLWMTLLENTGSPLMNVDTADGTMLLAMEGASQSGIVTVGDEAAVYQEGYVYVDVEIAAVRGWEAGLVLRHQDEDNYYVFKVNSSAQYRFEAVIAGEPVVMSDWTRHPAVDGRQEFSLGALLNGTTIEVFVDGEVIEAFPNLTQPQPGRVGFYAGTPDLFNASIEAHFDNYVITTPLELDNKPVFPAHVVVGTADDMLRDLQRRRLVPLTGAMVAKGQAVRVQDTAAGISRIRFTEGEYTNFVVGANVGWVQDKTGVGGCGIALREDGSDGANQYDFAFIGSDGRYGLQHREPDEFLPGGIYGEDLKPNNLYHMLLVVLDDSAHLFIDGVYYGTLEQATTTGSVSMAVVNFDPLRTVCSFQNAWLWNFDT
jgi:hypothetical protein